MAVLKVPIVRGASHGFTREEVELIATLFDYYDTGRQGRITVESAQLLLTHIGYWPAASGLIQVNEDGLLSIDLFLETAAGARSRELLGKDRRGNIRHFFRLMGREAGGSAANTTPGSATSTQLHKLFASMNVELPMPVVEGLIQTISREGDTSFTEDELLAFVEVCWRETRQDNEKSYQFT
jgi:hypothetical protein